MEGSIEQRFFRALCRVENPALDSKNPHFGNEFASLKATLKAIRKACEPEGLAYVQRIALLESGELVLRTSIISEDGEESERSIVPLGDNSDSQKFGSKLTYTRRQTAQADFGVTGEADDDAEAASSKPRDYSAINPLKRRYMQALGIDETEASRQLVQALGNPARLDDEGYRRYLQRMESLVKEMEKNG